VTPVALGEADAGIVYRTDVAGDVAVDAVDIPAASDIVAEYPIVAVTRTPAAQDFVAFVTGDDGRAALRDVGFGEP
jgi:molybdate transport system substrate-binding protein